MTDHASPLGDEPAEGTLDARHVQAILEGDTEFLGALGDVDIVRLLLTRGETSVGAHDAYGSTALHSAAVSGDPAAMERECHSPNDACAVRAFFARDASGRAALSGSLAARAVREGTPAVTRHDEG